MVLCPIALAVGCKRCPAFSVCPLKTVIGDFKPPAADKPASASAPAGGKAQSRAQGKPSKKNRKR